MPCFLHSLRLIMPTWLMMVFIATPCGAATSGICGYYTLSLPAGNSAWVCGLVASSHYQGAVASVVADTDGRALVTFASPGWSAGVFSSHYAEPLSGAVSGLALDILSNTTDTLKLDTTPAAAGIVAGMVLVVRAHATLGTLLPDGGGLAAFSDSISLFDSSSVQKTYLWNSISHMWIDGRGTDASSVVIRPGQGMVFQVGAARQVVIGTGAVCQVRLTPARIHVGAAITNIVGPLTPLATSTTLGATGMASSLQAWNDSIVVLTPGSLAQSGAYLSTGSGLIDGQGQDASAKVLPAGAGVVISVDSAKNINLSAPSFTP